MMTGEGVGVYITTPSHSDLHFISSMRLELINLKDHKNKYRK